MADLFGEPDGRRVESEEWGLRATKDNLLGRRGDVSRRASENEARACLGLGTSYGWHGSHELVRRTVITYTGAWEACR